MSDIRFSHIAKVFTRGSASNTVLKDINLHVQAQEFVSIVGPSGCGKTTMLRLAAGLDTPTDGQVSVGDRVIDGPGPDRAVVFQQFALFPWKTVSENIEFGLRCKGIPAADRANRVSHYLKLMNLEGRGDAYPHQLSGGMQQRVAIARSYALDPEVLLMDEPFGALDAQTRTVMQEELLRICSASRRTVLFITHAVEEAVYLSDRVIVMSRQQGAIVADIDIRGTRQSEDWTKHKKIEDVMDLASFMDLRTRIWKLLREQGAH